MKSILILLGLASLSLVNAAWVLVWEDNFNGGNLADKWNFEVNCDGGGNNELQCYTNNRAENVQQKNGILIITARREAGRTQPFTSTRMKTKANWLNGKFEIRARMPKGKHLWPAIWMMPAQSAYGTWPKSGEIDIAELRGQKPNQIESTLHFGPAWNNKGQVGTGPKTFSFDFSQDFHTFGLDWSSDRIQWLVDGKVIHTESLKKNFWSGLYTANVQPFDKNFYLIINLAVGGNFFGSEAFNPSESSTWAKNTLEIDYVKKWEWR